ncbi:DUF4136 domain-containing protein [Ideonella livida]|uniref:DUF4136 domain-containing protein n=1 Tax=Ideonella livida TaxID=2707176 RepID=A0A7C9TN52_9BURK|nr:DUF4136 domain-containing protein [Ideonella livida]NDY93882.1 DUF4136 domain-containing protein [Ideonella livida]
MPPDAAPTPPALHLATDRRRGLALLAALPLLGLGACASFQDIHCTVSSFGAWPAGRTPGTYAFDRLPSQRSGEGAEQQARLERLAAAALQAAGLKPASDAASADLLVQLGARVDRAQRSPWDDPFWPGPWGPRFGLTPFATPGWNASFVYVRTEYTREVAVLLRDRASGEALYEARAASTGLNAGSDALLGAMYRAALQSFPQAQPEPHTVKAKLATV